MESKVFYFQCKSGAKPNVGKQLDKALAKWLEQFPPNGVRIFHCVQSLTSPDRADKLVLTLFYTKNL